MGTWDGARRESGVQDFALGRGESPGMRFLRFNRWLEELTLDPAAVLQPRVELVVYEQPFVMRSGQAAGIALGLATRVQEMCARYKLEHVAVNGSRLKKWTTGKGNAKKPEMVAAVTRRFCTTPPYFVGDHNEADAIALLEYARLELVPERSKERG
jgi:crossover junction endodeoxyribonuclease RuvC